MDAMKREQQEQPPTVRPAMGVCAACGMVVVIDGGRFVRACTHVDAGVLVGLEARIAGEARLSA